MHSLQQATEGRLFKSVPGPRRCARADECRYPGVGGFEEEDVRLSVPRHGPMLGAARNDAEVAFRQLYVHLFPELDGKRALEHKEALIGRLVVVPVEGAFELRHLHVLAVECRHDAWGPLLVELAQFFGQAAVLHWQAGIAPEILAIVFWEWLPSTDGFGRTGRRRATRAARPSP